MRPVVAFIVGVFLASAIAYVVCSLHTGYINARSMSTVDAPVRMALVEIVATFDRDDPALGEAKVRLFESRWKQYIRTGELGDVHTDIANLRLPAK